MIFIELIILVLVVAVVVWAINPPKNK